MKLLVILIPILFFVFPFQEVYARQDKEQDSLKNQHAELNRVFYTLRRPDASGDLELSGEQSSRISDLASDLNDVMRYYRNNIEDRQREERLDEEARKLYETRMAEDLERIEKELKTDILLPHQVEVLTKIRKRVQLEWHINTEFKQIKGTDLEELEITEDQLKKLREIRVETNRRYQEEQARFTKLFRE